MKTRWIGLLAIAMLLIACDKKMDYVPIEAFEPSYKALQGAQGDNYDIEETIRILNGIELAQAQSENFDEFLEYMARQDYSQVAQDVVDLRVKLLPVLQEMYLIDQEYEHINLWSTLGRDLSTDVSQVVAEKTNPNFSLENVHGLLRIMSLTDIPTPNSIIVSSITKTGTMVFEQFEKNQKIKEDLSIRMHQVRKQYIEYLEDYIPVYNKYMQEWNQLCLIKDRAYLQLYSGQYESALKSCQEALTRDPDNREMHLLQCMAIIQSVEYPQASNLIKVSPNDIELGKHNDTVADPRLQVANQMLTDYIERHPNYSAAALLLKGIIQAKEGNKAEALVYFDQAAMEYPRQAEHLTDMLSSYRARTYLNNTAEGAYLLSLYQSTMEGFGMFSPNFAKAVLHEHNGDLMSAREEIYNHFFRRSNQMVYDCLLSDMEYCEEHLAFSFKQLLPENSYIDVIFKRSPKLMGMGNDNNKLQVSLHNRSDKTFENIRLFLCIHFTDMYKTEYHVVRVPALNRINANECIEIGEIELNYRNKSFNDITRVRAIALTDNTLCWIDNVYNADTQTYYNPTRSATVAELAGSANMKQRQRYFSSMNESASSISESLLKSTSIDTEISGNMLKRHTLLHIRLPRIVVMLDPVYLLNDAASPEQDYLQGSVAHLVFKDAPLQQDNQLTIKSVYTSYAIHFTANTDNTYAITGIDILPLEK